MSRILTVFGATGNQGGSVIQAVLADAALSSTYKIRAVTRDVNKPAAQALAAKGVELVSADMSSQEAVAPAVQGAHSVFFVTNFWESMSAETEIAQGKAVTDASKAAGVEHLIFSSLLSTTEITEGRLPNITHFDGKANIEKYIRESKVPATFVLPGMFMSGFYNMIQKSDDGSYILPFPISGETAKVPLIDAAADMGLFVRAALKKYPSLLGKRIYAANDYLTPSQIISQFSEVIGKPAVFKQIPNDVYKSFLPPPAAQELLENMLLLDDAGYYGGADVTESLSLIDAKPTSWREFVEKNKAKWL